MLPRTNYEMTDDDLNELLNSCKPTPVMMVGGVSAPTPEENANSAWESLGKQMGFDYMSVRPINGKGMRFFSAIPSENEAQKAERIEKQKETKRLEEIDQLKSEIAEKIKQLDELEA